MKPILLSLALLGFVSAASASGTKYVVKVRADKRTDFAQIKTYAWMVGWPAFDPSVDWQIEADVERELAALGLTKLPGEPCDAVLTYAAIRRTDVDVKSKVSLETGLGANTRPPHSSFCSSNRTVGAKCFAVAPPWPWSAIPRDAAPKSARPSRRYSPSIRLADPESIGPPRCVVSESRTIVCAASARR